MGFDYDVKYTVNGKEIIRCFRYFLGDVKPAAGLKIIFSPADYLQHIARKREQ